MENMYSSTMSLPFITKNISKNKNILQPTYPNFLVVLQDSNNVFFGLTRNTENIYFLGPNETFDQWDI